jgi:hypothetical protein
VVLLMDHLAERTHAWTQLAPSSFMYACRVSTSTWMCAMIISGKGAGMYET